MRLRLRQIFKDVDFRFSELTIYEKYTPVQVRESLRPGDAALFISRSGSQLLWVLHYGEMAAQKTQRTVIQSMKLRVSGGYWNPLMLQNYANEIGIELEGIKRFEELFGEQRDRKRAA